MHIYDFITDSFQYKLKHKAANAIPFENILGAYQTEFFEAFSQLNSADDPANLHPTLKGDQHAVKWLADLTTLVVADKPILLDLFKDIREVYDIFLRGNHLSAITYLHNLLDKYDLLDESYPDLLGGFLRGRFYDPSKRDDILHEYFYQHIPFTQRHLIKRQRFSFSGQPLLYAGQSLLSVYYELGAESLDDENIAVSLLAFNHFAKLHFGNGWEKIKSRSRIYDISNAIYETINGTFFKMRELNIPIPPIDGGPGFPKEKVLRDFRKLILSHCCTFRRKIFTRYDENKKKNIEVDMHFVEEYVLPQLLTEAVRLHKYNGIIYPSTKFVDKKITVAGDWQSNIYTTNLAMFTEYNKPVGGRVPLVDQDLFTVLEIDILDFKNLTKGNFTIKKLSLLDVHRLAEELVKSIREQQKLMHDRIPVTEAGSHIWTALYHIEKKVLLYQKMEVDGKAYLDWLAGKMEIIYLFRYFRYINGQFQKIFIKELQQTDEEERKAKQASSH